MSNSRHDKYKVTALFGISIGNPYFCKYLMGTKL